MADICLFHAMEGRRGEHAEPHQPRILNFETHLGGADVGIENGPDIVDPGAEDAIRVGVQPDIGEFPQPHVLQIVLKNVAHNPDVRHIGDRERIGRCQPLRPRGQRHLLIGDHAGNRRENVDDRAEMILVRRPAP